MSDAVIRVVNPTIPIEQRTITVDLVGPGAALALAAANDAEGHAEDAEGFRDEALAARDLSQGYAGQSSTSALLAGTSTSAAGAYLAGITTLTGGAPVNAMMSMPVASLAIMSAVTQVGGQPLVAGHQVLLSEAGKHGSWEWVAGNQKPKVDADPYKALWNPPAVSTGLATDGSQGAWHRLHDGRALASWASVLASGIGNYQPQLNSLLAHDEVYAVVLPVGTVMVSACVRVPSGKVFSGQGMDKSVLKATAAAGFAANQPEAYNSIVAMVDGGTGTRISDMTVDGNKHGDHVIGGVHALTTKRFSVERVTAKNCSGYAFWALCTGPYVFDACSGTFRDCWSYNANVHFETVKASNVLFDSCHARDGDADIGCESRFHPYGLSKNITYRDCTSIGSAGSQVGIGDYMPGLVENITFENCVMTSTGDSVAVSVKSFDPAGGIRNIQFNNCTIKCLEGLGIVIEAGASSADVHFDGGSVQGKAIGIAYDGASTGSVRGTKITVGGSGSGQQVSQLAIHPTAQVVLDGPILDTDRAFAYPQAFPSSANIRVTSPPVIMVPQSGILPFGIGHKVRIRLPADAVHTTGASRIGAETVNAFAFIEIPAGTFKVHVEGFYQTGETDTGIFIEAQRYGAGAIRGTAKLHGKADGTMKVEKPINSASPAIYSGSVDAIDTPYPFEMDFIFTGGDGSGGVGIGAGAYLSPDAGFGGTAKIVGDTFLTMERIA